MKKMKVFAWGLAILVLLSSGIVGCKKTGDSDNKADSHITQSDDGSKQEAVTFTVFTGEPGQQYAKDNKIYKLIEEKLGVKFEFEFQVGDLDQKLGVMVASGDYPDIIHGSSSADKLIKAGAFLPMQDMITDETPKLKKHIEPYINKIKEREDGNIYIIPNYGRYYGEDSGTWYGGPAFWIQKAVLKEFDYPEIKTLDEYFDIIKRYKEKYPEIEGQPTIGFEVLCYDWRSFCLKNAPAQLAGYPNDGGIIVNPDTYAASIYANTDIAKAYYKKLNAAYNDGLIKPETFVRNYDEYLAVLSSGAVLGMFDQGWQFEKAANSLIAQDRIERTYAPLPIVLDESITPYYRDRPPLNINRGYGISVDCENPERFVKLLDTFLSEEWQKIFAWGIEGEDYLVDDKGIFYRTEEQRANSEDPSWKLSNKAEALFGNLPKIEGTFSDGNATTPVNQPDEYFATLKPLDQEILNHYGIKSYPQMLGKAPENPKYYPAWQISLGNGTDAAVAEQKIGEVQVKYLPTLIMDSVENFDTVWEEYLARYHKINIKAYEDKVNEGIQWRINNW